MKKLDVLVHEFRYAIETAKRNNEPGDFFEDFPVGQCGRTSDMLAQFLIDNGISSIRYMNGTYYNENGSVMQSHSWLVVENMIIDITADQFQYCTEPLRNNIPVYIGPTNEFYQLFDMTCGSDHKHSGLQKIWFNYHELAAWYNIIVGYTRQIG